MDKNNFFATYLKKTLLDHAQLCYSERACQALTAFDIHFVSWRDISNWKTPGLLIPIDVDCHLMYDDIKRIKVLDVVLSTWEQFKLPLEGNWKSYPNEHGALFFYNEYNVIVPAWNVYGVLRNILTFQEEIDCQQLDSHGRFPSSSSPRYGNKLLQVPIFNEFAFFWLFIAISKGKIENFPPSIDEYILKPILVLSHDCDQLKGNDRYTQAIRLFRILKSIIKFKFSKLSLFFRIFENLASPRKYYFDDAVAMFEIEHQYGFKSSFYMLNGNRAGRFGSRSSIKEVKELANILPVGWEIGVHYNYGFIYRRNDLNVQIGELNCFLSSPIISGRAHYLIFDPVNSPKELENFDILFDESIGFPDMHSYRAGIAGIFKPISRTGDKISNIYELPLMFMDSNFCKNDDRHSKMFHHIEKIGGIISILWHPGSYNNPEKDELHGVYHKILREFHCKEFRCLTPSQILELI